MQAYVVSLFGSEGTSPVCLGIGEEAFGAAVQLVTLQAVPTLLTQWYLDPTSGFIRSAANEQMLLDVAGDGRSVLVWFFVPGRTTQVWNWLGVPRMIFNVGIPTACVTAASERAGAAVNILAPPASWQQWLLVPMHEVATLFTRPPPSVMPDILAPSP